MTAAAVASYLITTFDRKTNGLAVYTSAKHH